MRIARPLPPGGDVKKPRQSLTIVDIAQLAGVSKSTASRAL
ncbi:MAG: LacI family DNA-binding transcriptional regulator [Burkholderiaceae bacterium]|nr:LacI family DNA-binding transcriptional regulator [Burkholderiaceae bacterium]